MLTCSSCNPVRRHQVTVINDDSDVAIIPKIICLLDHESLDLPSFLSCHSFSKYYDSLLPTTSNLNSWACPPLLVPHQSIKHNLSPYINLSSDEIGGMISPLLSFHFCTNYYCHILSLFLFPYLCCCHFPKCLLHLECSF